MSRLLSVVVPCHNEEGNLRALYQEIVGQFRGVGTLTAVELILVDDGSTDRTLEVARELASVPA